MYNFTDFDDYRVYAWSQDGLITRVANVVRSVKASTRNAAASFAVGIAVAAFATINYSSEIAAPVWNGVDTNQEKAVAQIKRLRNELAQQLAQFGQNVHTQIDSSTLAFAQQAIAAVVARGTNVEADWAKKLTAGNA